MSNPKLKKCPIPDPAYPSDNHWKVKQELEKKRKKLFVQKIFAGWCKACSICIAFCPANVFGFKRTFSRNTEYRFN
jgi:ferredoxin